MKNYTYSLIKIYEKLTKHDYYYLISMTIYHLQILILISLLGMEYKVHTFLPMITPTHAEEISLLNYQVGINPYSIMLTIAILIVDFAFLYIIKKEIEHYETNHYKKFPIHLNTFSIIAIECFVFYLSMGNPFMRAVLYFMSFNTIQIYIIYRIVFKYLSVLRPLWIIGSYLSIISLFLYVIYDAIKFIWL